LHQHGVNMPMKRIDAATAQRIAGNRAEKLTETLTEKQQERISGGALVILPGP
jgi:hypothetical protein